MQINANQRPYARQRSSPPESRSPRPRIHQHVRSPTPKLGHPHHAITCLWLEKPLGRIWAWLCLTFEYDFRALLPSEPFALLGQP